MYRDPPAGRVDSTEHPPASPAWTSSSLLLAIERGEPGGLPVRSLVFAGAAEHGGVLRRVELAAAHVGLVWEVAVDVLAIEAGSVVRQGDTLVIPRSLDVVALDPRTGAVRWSRPRSAEAPRASRTGDVSLDGRVFEDVGSALRVWQTAGSAPPTHVADVSFDGWDLATILAAAGQLAVALVSSSGPDRIGLALVSPSTLAKTLLDLGPAASPYAELDVVDGYVVVQFPSSEDRGTITCVVDPVRAHVDLEVLPDGTATQRVRGQVAWVSTL